MSLSFQTLMVQGTTSDAGKSTVVAGPTHADDPQPRPSKP